MLKDIESRPTRIAELVPLLPSAEGHYDASGLGAGGVWFPSEHLVAREGFENKPIVWRIKWPQYIIDRLVTSDNPDGTMVVQQRRKFLHISGGCLEFINTSIDMSRDMIILRDHPIPLLMHYLVILKNHGKNYLHHSSPTYQVIQRPKCGILVPNLYLL